MKMAMLHTEKESNPSVKSQSVQGVATRIQNGLAAFDVHGVESIAAIAATAS